MTNNQLTEGQLLFRLQDFYGAQQDAEAIGDHEFAQECADIVSVIREVLERRRAAAKPVRYLNKFSSACVTLEQQPNAAEDIAVYMPLYAEPPVPIEMPVAFTDAKNLKYLDAGQETAKCWGAAERRTGRCGALRWPV